MAKTIVLDAYLALNFASAGLTPYSDNVKKVELVIEADEHDFTTMGSSGWRALETGLLKWSLSCDLLKDSDLSDLDLKMWTALTTRASVGIEVRLKSTSVGGTNPKYTGSIKIPRWVPIMGDVGQPYSGSYTFPGTGALTRATS